MTLEQKLEQFEGYAKDGWSKPMTLGKLGFKYSNHSFVLRVLNNNIQYRLLCMKYYADSSLNITKWIKEFDELPDDHEYRRNKLYSDAIQAAVGRYNSKREAKRIYHSTISYDDQRRLEHQLCQEVFKNNFNSNSMHEGSERKQNLPAGVRTVSSTAKAKINDALS